MFVSSVISLTEMFDIETNLFAPEFNLKNKVSFVDVFFCIVTLCVPNALRLIPLSSVYILTPLPAIFCDILKISLTSSLLEMVVNVINFEVEFAEPKFDCVICALALSASSKTKSLPIVAFTKTQSCPTSLTVKLVAVYSAVLSERLIN